MAPVVCVACGCRSLAGSAWATGVQVLNASLSNKMATVGTCFDFVSSVEREAGGVRRGSGGGEAVMHLQFAVLLIFASANVGITVHSTKVMVLARPLIMV